MQGRDMATRRQCREWTLQLLFQLDLNPDDKLDDVYRAFWSDADKQIDARGRRFVEELVSGVRGSVAEIDSRIQELTEHWDIHRMGVVERNVLRMAFYEMQHRKDIPAAVSINEAVDIAKYFSSSESGKFVNGVLDRARKALQRAGRK